MKQEIIQINSRNRILRNEAINEERKLLHVIISLNICTLSNTVKKMGILRIVDRILCIWKNDNEKGVLQTGV